MRANSQLRHACRSRPPQVMHPKVVGRFVALAMMAQVRTPLAKIDKFYGAGVYALYYVGKRREYAPLSKTETPIYVGKADPKDGTAMTAREQGAKLAGRLMEHRRSVELAKTTLDVADFEYRSLVVQSGWQGAADGYLIDFFRPVWNSEVNIVYGVGKHGDAAETRANKRSPWDTLHPGRPWTVRTKENAKTLETIKQELTTHFTAQYIYKTFDEVIGSFVKELRQL